MPEAVLSPTRNLAARMGRWSARHRRLAIGGWMIFVIGALMIGSSVGQKTIDQSGGAVGQAVRANLILDQGGFPHAGTLTELVVIQSPGITTSDPRFRAAVADVVRTASQQPAVHNLRSPFDPRNHDQIARGGRTALVEWDMAGPLKAAEQRIDPITAAVAKAAHRHPGFYIAEAGDVSSDKAISKMFGEQLGQAGIRSVPLTLLILVLVFGSLLAAAVPLALGLMSVIATIGIADIISHLTPMDPNVQAVVMLVGLAVGVDYSLFYLRREREERAAGRRERAALYAAAATSGRAVLVSGATVIIAMAGMLLSSDPTFTSFSIATMIVVAVAMIGSLTVLPALLAALGDRVEKGRIPLLGRLRRPAGTGGRVWPPVLRQALAHPAATAAAAVTLLVVLAVPALHIHTAQSGTQGLPRSAPTVGTLNRIQSAFGSEQMPAIVAVKADTQSPRFGRAVAALSASVARSGGGYGSPAVKSNADDTVARISIPLPGRGTDTTSTRALLTLRNHILPATIGTIPGASYAVTGQTAGSYDWNQMMKSKLPLVFGFVLTFAFLLLLTSFRSVVIAAKAVALNLLSVAAAYGVVVAVFQDGWGAHALDFTSDGAIVPWLPLFMFVILFGLSMDYHVFILSRVREAYDRGMSTDDAIMQGITSTAGTVSSAALVMVGAFSIFATLPILDMKEMGVGLAVAVLIDATIVRGLLLPATMKLLGRWNWYLPRWLRWLPRVEHGAPPAPAPTPTPVAA
jgi:uncharacterized membrane protein YdfJ with MMPL/SSD domain